MTSTSSSSFWRVMMALVLLTMLPPPSSSCELHHRPLSWVSPLHGVARGRVSTSPMGHSTRWPAASSSTSTRTITKGVFDDNAMIPGTDIDINTAFDSAVGVATLVVGALVVRDLIQEQPQGWIAPDSVYASKSTLGIMGGKGLFARQRLPEGTTLGSYPGVIYPRDRWTSTKASEEAAILAARYAWVLPNGDILDPTDEYGNLPDTLNVLGFIKRIPTVLALVNEPPSGGDTNIVAVITDQEVTYVTERDISAGEELFVDYGPNYDRRHYARLRR